MIDWKKIRKEYEETDITASALAKKYSISPSTLRSRKNRGGWQRGARKMIIAGLFYTSVHQKCATFYYEWISIK